MWIDWAVFATVYLTAAMGVATLCKLDASFFDDLTVENGDVSWYIITTLLLVFLTLALLVARSAR